MSTIFLLEKYLLSRQPVGDAELNEWITYSDVANAAAYFESCTRIKEVLASVKSVCEIIATRFLNDPQSDADSLHRKTKFCLLLNNFALYPAVRHAVFESLSDKLTSIFESSIKEEGTMPFVSQLGRMSEHVLVLIMRITNYTLNASAVHEFAEGNTQFAIQLLLAILLKEPPYEFILRCNCISGLLGLTQPQAFFTAGQGIEEHSCEMFTNKIDFMMNLMLRLCATQVVSDILAEAIMSSGTLEPIVQGGVNNLMRTILSIYKFSSTDVTQWRQHIVLSTTFLDGTVMMYIHSLTSELQTALAQTPPTVSGELLQSLNLSFKFGAFATYRLEESASGIRHYCTFFHDLLQFSIRPVVMDARVSGQIMVMYCNLLHFMCNVDALAGEAGLDTSDLLPELTSAALKGSVEKFLTAQVGACGLPFTQAWHQRFQRVDSETLLDRDTITYQVINGLFKGMVQQMQAQQPVVAAPTATSDCRLLGEVPSLKPKKSTKVSIDKAAAPVTVKKVRMAPKGKDVTSGVDTTFLCALTGNVMKNPVTSPDGYTFEKGAILAWLEQNGSVCPITGRPLTAAQLTSNTGVAAKIMQQVVTQTMAEDDLYNF